MSPVNFNPIKFVTGVRSGDLQKPPIGLVMAVTGD
jgi:hypothetical protein